MVVNLVRGRWLFLVVRYLGIHDVDKDVIGFSLPIITFFCFCRIPQLHLDKTTHKYIIIGSTNPCSLGTRTA